MAKQRYLGAPRKGTTVKKTTVTKQANKNDNSKTGKALRYSGAIGGKQQYKWQSKVDRAFEALEAQGIVARHDFSDCITGGVAEIEDEVKRFAKSGKPIGYTFYHGQDTYNVDDSGILHLAFGPLNGDSKAARLIGERVRDVLLQQGLEVMWSGCAFERIAVRVSGHGKMSSGDGGLGKHFSDMERMVEDGMLALGFRREHDMDDAIPEGMVFSDENSLRLLVTCDLNGIKVGGSIQFDAATRRIMRPLNTIIAELNNKSQVGQFIPTEDQGIVMVANLPLPKVSPDTIRSFLALMEYDFFVFQSVLKSEFTDAA